MLISSTGIFPFINQKQAIFETMMQQVLFLSAFLKQRTKRLWKKAQFSHRCIQRFLKAIVFLHKKVTTFFLIIEDQYFLSKNVGLLFLGQINSKNQYLRQ